MGEIFAIIFGAIFINNFVLSRFLGICPFMGVSKKVETSLGMGMAVTFVMGLASFVTWLLEYYVLVPNQLEYLRTIVFILVIASLVQFVELVIRKASPTLYQSLGIFLPLITTNCAVLGVAILNIQLEYNLFEAVVFGVAAAVGFTLALVIMAGIRERLELVFIPKHFQGVSIAMIIAGILSLAFGGFKGMM
ncbi:MAG: electron transport complex subunit RsxA [Dethiobacter sp.]|nr:electron transport complex subunit RsxA [Dethiobacter sp.]MBS3899535.1 electron transport complex subunit RsxA [Dethiobacter sp.]MBS3983332.1 electron transport complex subunit RsxA [Dethiobacter sp.]